MLSNNIKLQSDSHFKTLKNGTKIFYPQGPLSRRGYYVSSPELEPKLRQDIRRFHRRQVLWCAVLGAFAGSLAMINIWVFILIICFCSCLGWLTNYLYFAKYTKEMEPAPIANSPIFHWSKWGESAHPASLFGYMLLWIVLSGVSIWSYSNSYQPQMLLCIVFFALMFIPGGVAIYGRFFKKKTH